MSPWLASISPEQIGNGVVTLFLAALVAHEKWTNRNKTKKIEETQDSLAEAKVFKERGDMLLVQVEEYKTMLEKERMAHEASRKFHHDQATIAQEKMSACNDKCLELQARTDITRIETMLGEQTRSLVQIGSGIQKLLERGQTS